MPIKAQPFAHQQEAYAAALEIYNSGQSPGYALLMEMGTGKSLTSIGITGALHLAGKVNRVLVVAPLSIVGVCQEEFYKFTAFDYGLTVLSGTGTKKADALRQMQGDVLQVVVINYESAWRMEKELLACASRTL